MGLKDFQTPHSIFERFCNCDSRHLLGYPIPSLLNLAFGSLSARGCHMQCVCRRFFDFGSKLQALHLRVKYTMPEPVSDHYSGSILLPQDKVCTKNALWLLEVL